jgi:hypothetical protein
VQGINGDPKHIQFTTWSPLICKFRVQSFDYTTRFVHAAAKEKIHSLCGTRLLMLLDLFDLS